MIDLENGNISATLLIRNLAETFKPEYLKQKKAARLGADLNNTAFNSEEIMDNKNRIVTLNVSKSNNFRKGGDL